MAAESENYQSKNEEQAKKPKSPSDMSICYIRQFARVYDYVKGVPSSSCILN